MPSTLVVTVLPDGSLKTDARKMQGSEKEILAELNLLAAKIGPLTVEKHEPGRHVHHHGDERTHSHG